VTIPPEVLHTFKKTSIKKTRVVSHGGLAIYIFKKYLKAKEELWKLKYFTM
jgi:predicted transcriptional regulator